VQETLRALETIGAIRKEGEPNRDGTLYRVLIPEEIEACRRHRAERRADEQELQFPSTGHDNDALHANRIKAYERDGYVCRSCGKQLTRFTATVERVKQLAEGGDLSVDNLVTLCLDCNARRSQQPAADVLAEK
jgi:5-methylcytosine-specific restriction endonuclease McrA